MPKFTLIAEHTDNNNVVTSKVTHEFTEDFLPNVIMHTQEFLRGTGFYFDGELEIMDYKSFDGPSSTACDDQHSEHWFASDRNR